MDNTNTEDIKQITFLIPKNLNTLKPEIETIIIKNENIIKKYIEKTIYASVISEKDKTKLEEIFLKHRNFIIDKF